MRVKLFKGQQKEFLDNVAKKTRLSPNEISRLSGVCRRTYFDWRREKHQMTHETLLKLQKISRIPLPKNIKILPEYWSTKKAARLGAIRRYELYGNPGTPEGRRKGGMASRNKTRKEINIPRKSPLLAEFAGILLGDGGIRGNHQVTISYNTKTDREFSVFIRRVASSLFGVNSSIYPRKGTNGADIVISGTNLVEFLSNVNILKRGNKIANQIDIPGWIKAKRNYKISCLRGLMDTDGGVYYHKYKINRQWYRYPRLSFSSASAPLLRSVGRILENLDFNPKIGANKITLYRLPEIKRYFEEIGTHNPKHCNRYKAFCNNS